MNLSLYVPGTTPLHRLPAGVKFGAVFAAGVGLFLTDSVAALGVAAACAAALLLSTRASPATLGRQLAGVAVMLAVLFVVAALVQDLTAALTMLLRILALLTLALSVTLTTRAAELLEFLETLLAPLARVGLADPERVGLSVSLVLRFLPEVFRRYQEIREAQSARGARGNPVALAVPLIVRTLKSADDIAEAIDARCYPPPRRSARDGAATPKESP